MSRVGKLPVKVPNSIKVAIDGNMLSFSDGKNSRSYKVMPSVDFSYDNGEIKFFSKEGYEKSSVDLGMDRSNVNNIVSGMSNPFKITLEINGVGYKASVETFAQSSAIVLSLGYSHDIFYLLPEGVTANFEKPNFVVLTSINKILVGQVASEIISFRSPEPYKGKGVNITGRKIVRKEGKKK